MSTSVYHDYSKQKVVVASDHGMLVSNKSQSVGSKLGDFDVEGARASIPCIENATRVNASTSDVAKRNPKDSVAVLVPHDKSEF